MENPVALILDNHAICKDFEDLFFFKKNVMRVFHLPPWINYHLCPLGVCYSAY